MAFKKRHYTNNVRKIYGQLGFDSLRPIQESALSPVIRGDNCLLVAPTSGGKTEAALVPVLESEQRSTTPPVSILYLAPMRALINDLEPRLYKLAKCVGKTVCRWHSDVPKDIRTQFLSSPTDILLTTPESLESFLLFHSGWAITHFSNIHTVIIDELHAYGGNDRGAHLFALLERLRTAYCGDFQRIALSATVGNPHELLEAASQNSHRKKQVVQIRANHRGTRIRIRYAQKASVFESMLRRLNSETKHLIFAENRQSVEWIGAALHEQGIGALVTHSSLPASHRELSERLFSRTSDKTMIATSVLEMGIDIGDLEHIVQINAPASVGNYLQRLGRAGRRKGLKQCFTFICRDPYALLQATALTELQNQNYIEPVIPLQQAVHVLVQQILSMAFSTTPVSNKKAMHTIKRAVPFGRLSTKDIGSVIQHMKRTGFLKDATTLTPGEKAIQHFGSYKKRNLCSNFQTPFEYIVLHRKKEIGRLDALFVMGKREGEFRFILSARNWLAMTIDHQRHYLTVEPVKDAWDSVWTGQGLPLSYDLCQCMHHILTTEYETSLWEHSAKMEMEKLRAASTFLSPTGITLKRNHKKKWCLHTFAGKRANALLAYAFTHLWKTPAVHSNFSIVFPETQNARPIQIAIAEMKKQKRPNLLDAQSETFPILQNISKFEMCIPENLKRKAWAEQLFDVASSQKTVQKRLHMTV